MLVLLQATTDSIIWALDRFSFRRILANVSETQLHEYENFLKNVDLLAPLSSRERSKVAEALEEVVFAQGEIICKQGDPGDCMYILRLVRLFSVSVYRGLVSSASHVSIVPSQGEVSCTIDAVEVKRYKDAEYFGERALMKDEPRAATCVAASPTVVVLKLDRTAFSLLLGPLEDIMQRRISTYSALPHSDSKMDMSVSGPAGAGTSCCRPTTLREYLC